MLRVYRDRDRGTCKRERSALCGCRVQVGKHAKKSAPTDAWDFKILCKDTLQKAS